MIMTDISSKPLGIAQMKKYKKKVARCLHILKNDFRNDFLEDSNESNVLFVGNLGHTTGHDETSVLQHLVACGSGEGVESVLLIPGKQYSFVTFVSDNHANVAHERILKKVGDIPTEQQTSGNSSKLFYIALVSKVPDGVNSPSFSSPPGSQVLEDFISVEEEEALLSSMSWEDAQLPSTHLGSSLKHRQVRHFGYEFQYGTNTVDRNAPLSDAPIPPLLHTIAERMVERGLLATLPDQITVNRYLPGQGIPSHTDSHSSCGPQLVSLSAGSDVVMNFLNGSLTAGCSPSSATDAAVQCDVLLPRRSLLVLTGDSRYRWRHGIKERHTDLTRSPDEGQITLQQRGIRTSFTFRTPLGGPCKCGYPGYCDLSSTFDARESNNGHSNTESISQDPSQLEQAHVHQVYDNIAHHFSDTRHKPWPNVEQFVRQLPCGSSLLDVGCGNGKYLGLNNNIMQVGCDSSGALLAICRDRGHQSVHGNCLSLPFTDGAFDAAICIAVLHHLASSERRRAGLEELLRVLRPGGRALVYVWAMEQRKHGRNSSYLRQNKRNVSHSYTISSVTDGKHNIREVDSVGKRVTVDAAGVTERSSFAMPTDTDAINGKHNNHVADSICKLFTTAEKCDCAEKCFNATNSHVTEAPCSSETLEISSTNISESHGENFVENKTIPVVGIGSAKSVDSTGNKHDETESCNIATLNINANGKSLPIHENRTDFIQQDMLVPWKVKPQKKTRDDLHTASDVAAPVYHRFYHTFKEGELEVMCSSVKGLEIVSSYYDEGNWCIIFQKSITEIK